MNRPLHLWRRQEGATAAEFALVVPLLLILIFALIDAGRLMWTMNRAEKAVQAGARFAVVTNVIPTGLASYSFVSDDNPPGSRVTTDQFGSIVCSAPSGTPSCSCASTPCTSAMIGTANPEAFSALVARMRSHFPEMNGSDVTVRYEGVGLGYAGNPYGADVSPLVTVEVANIGFQPITLLVFDGVINLPVFRSSLTLEDGTGTESN